jgi:hypothetical protein
MAIIKPRIKVINVNLDENVEIVFEEGKIVAGKINLDNNVNADNEENEGEEQEIVDSPSFSEQDYSDDDSCHVLKKDF